MADQFVGEIRTFGFNFAPVGWALCAGQTLPISQNTALFSLLGTQFGGNGTTNFQLPNLQGLVAVDYGSGPGLTPRVMGETGGEESVTLQPSQIPQHVHSVQVSTAAATTPNPSGQVPAVTTRPTYAKVPTNPTQYLSPAAIEPTPASQPHENRQPSLVVNYCIALTGIFPARG